jgi:phosphoserine phosphatase RsbU/P
MTQSLKLINPRPTRPALAVAGALLPGPAPLADRDPWSRNARERDEILGIVSHELRNSLSAICYWSTALLQEPATPQTTRNAANILASAKRMNGIIHDLLDVGRLQRGGALELLRTPSDAHEICRQIVGEQEAGHPRRQIQLRLQGDATGRWDVGRIEQVVSNLISNALQYGAQGAPVTVESHGDDDHWLLSVHNLGAAISPVLLPRLFDAFARGPDATKQAGANHLGIGLFIVRQAVLAHGGTIDVSSSVDAGTRFVVRLPRAVSR